MQKQTVVSHSSTEANVTSLDAGLRMEELPALTLWNLVIDVLEPLLILSQEETLCIHESNVMQRKTNRTLNRRWSNLLAT